jgi:hypothetical protein
MKKVLTTSLAVGLIAFSAPTFSSTAHQKKNTKSGATESNGFTGAAPSSSSNKLITGSVGVSACSLYCSAVGPAGLILMTSSAVTLAQALDGQGKELAKAILNDTQEFYQNGTLTTTLAQFISQRSSESELSENEMIDELNDFALSLLVENH